MTSHLIFVVHADVEIQENTEMESLEFHLSLEIFCCQVVLEPQDLQHGWKVKTCMAMKTSEKKTTDKHWSLFVHPQILRNLSMFFSVWGNVPTGVVVKSNVVNSWRSKEKSEKKDLDIVDHYGAFLDPKCCSRVTSVFQKFIILLMKEIQKPLGMQKTPWKMGYSGFWLVQQYDEDSGSVREFGLLQLLELIHTGNGSCWWTTLCNSSDG